MHLDFRTSKQVELYEELAEVLFGLWLSCFLENVIHIILITCIKPKTNSHVEAYY